MSFTIKEVQKYLKEMFMFTMYEKFQKLEISGSNESWPLF